MGIVSYAQNFEDVLLNRVFGSVHYAFYVDIGAYHPVNDSVTKSFYDRGWDGINVEPGDIFDELAAARPRDINLQMAVCGHSGTVGFAQHPGWYAGLSHVQAETLAPSDAVATQPAVETRTVNCDTLTNILDRYASGRPIAFLKIDAEGSEADIVRSTDWRVIRPTVILIEATKPRSTVLDNQSWEPVLLEQGYQRAYFDGINCFYVPEERTDLLRCFELPVNVLDGFKRFDPQLEAAHAQAAQAQAQAAAAEARVHQLAAELARTSAGQGQYIEQNTALQRELESTRERLETTRERLETLAATQNEAVAAVVEANTYQVAGLSRQLAELEADCASIRRERDALLGVREEALRLRRLMRELRWPDGPGALRIVLPFARLLRRFAGTRVPPVPPEELALLAPGTASVSVATPVPTAAIPTQRRSMAKRAAWLAYRPFRPVGRPAALRLRAFLTMQIHSEFMRLDEKLNRIRDDLARTPTVQITPGTPSSDPGLAELQAEIRQFGKLLEDTLLTMAMDSTAARELTLSDRV